MFKTNAAWVRKLWLPGFILFICMGLIVISQQTFSQGVPVPKIEAKHAQEALCAPNQIFKVHVFWVTKCVPQPLEGASVELIRGCTVVGSGTTGPKGNVKIVYTAPCPPPHCYLIVKATFKDWTPYLGATLLAQPKPSKKK